MTQDEAKLSVIELLTHYLKSPTPYEAQLKAAAALGIESLSARDSSQPDLWQYHSTQKDVAISTRKITDADSGVVIQATRGTG